MIKCSIVKAVPVPQPPDIVYLELSRDLAMALVVVSDRLEGPFGTGGQVILQMTVPATQGVALREQLRSIGMAIKRAPGY